MDTSDMTMAERDEKIIEMIRANVPMRKIANEFHLTEPRIYQIRRAWLDKARQEPA